MKISFSDVDLVVLNHEMILSISGCCVVSSTLVHSFVINEFERYRSEKERVCGCDLETYFVRNLVLFGVQGRSLLGNRIKIKQNNV